MARTKDQIKDINRAKSSWRSAEIRFNYYMRYLRNNGKRRKIDLELEDLLYTSNFKGGMSTISESPSKLKRKLAKYSRQLSIVISAATTSAPTKLSKRQFEKFADEAEKFLKLCLQDSTRIHGFGPANAAALAAAYLPTKLPVLDYRVLNGARIRETNISDNPKTLDSQELFDNYRPLLGYCYKRLRKNPKLDMRKLDAQLFCRPLAD
jgi:hypothetical protein